MIKESVEMTKGIIFGISGTIGKALHQALSTRGSEIYGTYNNNHPGNIASDRVIHLPVDKVELLGDLLGEIQPDFVIMALRGDFDKQLEFHVQVANYISDNGGRMVFCSTSNVFDAVTDAPHFEDDQPKAISDYGQYKIECERILKDILGSQLTIVRIPAIYGHESPRIKTLREDLANDKAIQIFTNLYSTTNTDKMLSKQIAYLIKQQQAGIYHLATNDVMSHSEFTRKLVLNWGYSDVQFEEREIETDSSSHIYDNSLLTRHEYPTDLQLSHEQLIKFLANSKK